MVDEWSKKKAQHAFIRALDCTSKWRKGVARKVHSDQSGFNIDQVSANKNVCSPLPTKYPPLDKPLPPTPEEAIDTKNSESGCEVNFAQICRSSTANSTSTLGSVFRLGRRRAIYQRESKTKMNQQMQPSRCLTGGKIKTPPMAPYLDKGTQTDHNSFSNKDMWKDHISLPLTYNMVHAKPAFVTKESERSIWSPRKIFTNSGPTDYFFAQAASLGRPSLQGLLTQESISSSATQRRIPIEDEAVIESEKRRSRWSLASADSLGSYESRYSLKNVNKGNVKARPARQRRSQSDTKIPGIRKSISETTERDFTQNNDSILPNPQKRMSLVAANSEPIGVMPFPFQKFPSFAGGVHRAPKRKGSRGSLSPLRRPAPNQRNSSKSSSTASSNLRQEYRLSPEADENPPRNLSDAPMDYFRVRMSTESPPCSPILEFDVPDHLDTSPLCPRHPKHPSGGVGRCPMHGLNAPPILSPSELSDDDKYSVSTVKEMPKQFHDGAIPIGWGLPDHGADDLSSPAGLYAREICLYHKWRLNCDSEDSLPRIPIK